MCKIRYIKKVGNKVDSDTIIKIPGSDFDVLNKPYYVSRIVEPKCDTFLFFYQDEEKSQDIYSYDSVFEITFGCKTGRLYSLKINPTESVSNLNWTTLDDKIKEANLLGKPYAKILLFGIKIVQKIYQNQFERNPD